MEEHVKATEKDKELDCAEKCRSIEECVAETGNRNACIVEYNNCVHSCRLGE